MSGYRYETPPQVEGMVVVVVEDECAQAARSGESKPVSTFLPLAASAVGALLTQTTLLCSTTQQFVSTCVHSSLLWCLYPCCSGVIKCGLAGVLKEGVSCFGH